uniref:Proto-oncogene Mas-like n=1 Tax=Geotrypetes seraphini TaxID=260995 RepID=A0A6P8NWB4_GEOSA|nr:proto-oncogene Mas-like [Geotrypetes seraphini]
MNEHNTTAILTSNWTRTTFFDDFSPLEISLLFLSVIIAVLGTIGNGIVLYFLSFKIKRNKFIVYILNLAVADLLFLLCVIAAVLLSLPRNGIHLIYVKIIAFSHRLAYNTGLYLLTAISLERCLSILYPLWYHFKRPKHQSAIVCTILWTLSSLVTGIESFLCLPLKWYLLCLKSVFLSTGVITFLFFTPLMVLSSMTLLIKIQRTSQHRHPPKLYLVIMVTVLIFLIFALPFKLLLTIMYICYIHLPNRLMFSALLFSVISSTANPFVYFLIGSSGKQRGRASIKVALQRVFIYEKDEEMTLNSNRANTNVLSFNV